MALIPHMVAALTFSTAEPSHILSCQNVILHSDGIIRNPSDAGAGGDDLFLSVSRSFTEWIPGSWLCERCVWGLGIR